MLFALRIYVLLSGPKCRGKAANLPDIPGARAVHFRQLAEAHFLCAAGAFYRADYGLGFVMAFFEF